MKSFRYFDEIGYLFQDMKNGYPGKVQILKTGNWNHPIYGQFEITEKDLLEFKDNFDKKVRKIDIFLDVEHMPEKGAVAKFKELIIEGGALYASVDWTEWGKEVLDKRLFSYISPEFSEEWEDAESGEKHYNVLFGAALTNRPFIKGMEPVLLSERMKGFTLYQYKQQEGEEKMLKEILGLFGLKEDAKLEDVKSKIEEMKGTASFKEITKTLELKEDTPVTEVVKKLGEVITEAKDLKEKSKAKEGTVTLSEAEVKQLKEDAKLGKDAAAKLALNEATQAVEKALSEGKLVPAQREWAMKEAQRDIKAFNEFVKTAPKVITTDESGSEAGNGLLKASEEVDKKVKELMGKDTSLVYVEALKQVLNDKELAKRYSEERSK